MTWNGKKVRTISDIPPIPDSGRESLTVLRPGADDPLQFEIDSRKVTFDYAYIPIKTRYKLNVRVSKNPQDRTEVKIINYEEADFGHQTQYGWQPNYQVIQTSTLREKVILDDIELQLKNIPSKK